jgi:hypothetical protein
MSLADARWGGLTAKKKWSILTIKKMVWESYSTKEKGMLKYAGDPLRFDSPVSLKPVAAGAQPDLAVLISSSNSCCSHINTIWGSYQN